MRIDEEVIVAAKWQLDNQFRDVDDVVRFWALFGPSVYKAPQVEQIRPWYQGFEDLFPKVKFRR